jgi:predicted transcriptional regulator
MSSRHTTLRLPDDLRDKLDALAKQEDRSVAYMISTAVRRMIGEHEALLAAVEIGIADIDQGRVIEHDEVMRQGQAVIDAAIVAAHAKRAV